VAAVEEDYREKLADRAVEKEMTAKLIAIEEEESGKAVEKEMSGKATL
jgi:hypothetical protein